MIITILLLCLADEGTLLAQTKNGFKGEKWGTSVTAMKKKFELKFIGSEQGKATYTSNVSSIGEAKLSDCAFLFYKDRFFRVLMHASDYTNSRRLLAILKQAYGEGSQPNKYSEQYLWRVDHTTIYYDELGSDKAWVTLHSNPIWEEMEAEEKSRVKKGIEDL